MSNHESNPKNGLLIKEKKKGEGRIFTAYWYSSTIWQQFWLLSTQHYEFPKCPSQFPPLPPKRLQMVPLRREITPALAKKQRVFLTPTVHTPHLLNSLINRLITLMGLAPPWPNKFIVPISNSRCYPAACRFIPEESGAKRKKPIRS